MMFTSPTGNRLVDSPVRETNGSQPKAWRVSPKDSRLKKPTSPRSGRQLLAKIITGRMLTPAPRAWSNLSVWSRGLRRRALVSFISTDHTF